uniref:Leucine-rich repeat domain-containing protein n=1 Tax=Parastrongyloides trichosuri TaxID=131310 RepID=A0A0N4ZAB8_PARTI
MDSDMHPKALMAFEQKLIAKSVIDKLNSITDICNFSESYPIFDFYNFRDFEDIEGFDEFDLSRDWKIIKSLYTFGFNFKAPLFKNLILKIHYNLSIFGELDYDERDILFQEFFNKAPKSLKSLRIENVGSFNKTMTRTLIRRCKNLEYLYMKPLVSVDETILCKFKNLKIVCFGSHYMYEIPENIKMIIFAPDFDRNLVDINEKMTAFNLEKLISEADKEIKEHLEQKFKHSYTCFYSYNFAYYAFFNNIYDYMEIHNFFEAIQIGLKTKSSYGYLLR